MFHRKSRDILVYGAERRRGASANHTVRLGTCKSDLFKITTQTD